jgi:hypothetical protein
MVVSKTGQRWGGVLMMLIGAGGTYWQWQMALKEDSYFIYGAIAPAFLVIGLMPLLYPMSREQWIAKQQKLLFDKIKDYPFGQKVILVIAILAGLVNWAFISGTLPWP